MTLVNHKHLVPKQTPPFVIIMITNGLETKTLVHLQDGVRKEAYGNILDEFEVKDYCDSFYFKNQKWKLGSPSVCKGRSKDMTADTLPLSVKTIPLTTPSRLIHELLYFLQIGSTPSEINF